MAKPPTPASGPTPPATAPASAAATTTAPAPAATTAAPTASAAPAAATPAPPPPPASTAAKAPKAPKPLTPKQAFDEITVVIAGKVLDAVRLLNVNFTGPTPPAPPVIPVVRPRRGANWGAIIVVLVLIVLMFLGGYWLYNQAGGSKQTDFTQAIVKFQTSVNDLAANTNKAIGDLSSKVNDQGKAITDTNATLATLNGTVSAQGTAIDGVTAGVATATKAITDQGSQLTQLATTVDANKADADAQIKEMQDVLSKIQTSPNPPVVDAPPVSVCPTDCAASQPTSDVTPAPPEAPAAIQASDSDSSDARLAEMNRCSKLVGKDGIQKMLLTRTLEQYRLLMPQVCGQPIKDGMTMRKHLGAVIVAASLLVTPAVATPASAADLPPATSCSDTCPHPVQHVASTGCSIVVSVDPGFPAGAVLTAWASGGTAHGVVRGGPVPVVAGTMYIPVPCEFAGAARGQVCMGDGPGMAWALKASWFQHAGQTLASGNKVINGDADIPDYFIGFGDNAQ